MAYGTIKVDQITFTNGGSDQTITVSGIVESISGNITATGTIQADTIIGTTTVSGATVTGAVGQFTTATITSGVFASGTAAAPSVSVGTTSNGIYSPGTNQLALSTNGTGRLFVDAGGRVIAGVNSTADVNDGAGASFTPSLFATTTSGTAGIGAFVSDGANNRRVSLFIDQTNAIWGLSAKWSSGQPDFAIRSGATERLRITSAGLVGIGTSAPSTSLALTTATTTALAGFESFAEFNKSGASTTDQGGGIVFSQGGNRRAAIGGFAQSGGTDGYLSLWTRPSSGNLVERLRIINNGNVGIGTTSPLGSLHVRSAAAGGTDPTLANNSIFEGAGAVSVMLNGDDTSTQSIYFRDASTAGNSFRGAIRYTHTDDALALFSAGSERARIDSSGRLGIGTSSPGTLLECASSAANGPVVRLHNSSTSIAADTEYGRFEWYSSDTSTGGTGISNYIGAYAINAGVRSALTFGVRHDSGVFEAMRLDSLGRLGIGTTSPLSPLHVNASGGAELLLQDGSAGSGTNYVSIKADGTSALRLMASTGTTDKDITFYTDSTTERARIDSSGRLLVGTSSDSGGALLQVNGNRIRVATAKTPASASDTGTTGEICWDASYIYVCTATNTWKRAALSTW